MPLVTVSYQAPKEANDVRVAIIGLLEKLKGGVPPIEAIIAELTALSAAVNQADQIPEEFKQYWKQSCELSGHLGGSIIGTLFSPKASPQEGDEVGELGASV